MLSGLSVRLTVRRSLGFIVTHLPYNGDPALLDVLLVTLEHVTDPHGLTVLPLITRLAP